MQPGMRALLVGGMIIAGAVVLSGPRDTVPVVTQAKPVKTKAVTVKQQPVVKEARREVAKPQRATMTDKRAVKKKQEKKTRTEKTRTEKPKAKPKRDSFCDKVRSEYARMNFFERMAAYRKASDSQKKRGRECLGL